MLSRHRDLEITPEQRHRGYPGRVASGVDRLLEEARASLDRVTPEEAAWEMGSEATLVDIRSEGQRAADGVIPGAVFVPRNVLEWRLDPSCPDREPDLARIGARVILLCDEGYQSSLAAATLRRLEVDATDVIGGFQAWRAAGLRVDPPKGDGRSPGF